jgi:myo-inositol-1(or 4)-monophosphatase
MNYLSVAEKAVLKNGPLFKKYFGKPKTVKSKSQDLRNLFTEVDLAIEKNIRHYLKKTLPTHSIIGEELGNRQLNTNSFYWAIDPIDGTNNFIQGIPLCCISLALWQKDTPLAAVIYNPVTKELFTAQKGKGAKLNGKKILVSSTDSLDSSYGGIGWSSEKEKAKKLFNRMLEGSGKIRALGSSALELCYLANGKFDFFVTSDIKFWDFAAGSLILTEAGGKASQIDGKKINIKSQDLLSTNSKLYAQLLRLLKNPV